MRSATGAPGRAEVDEDAGDGHDRLQGLHGVLPLREETPPQREKKTRRGLTLIMLNGIE